MLAEAVECEVQFAEDLLEQGVSGLSPTDMREYLQHVADRRLGQLGIAPLYGAENPFAFMELQDVQELSNFFERRVSAYQVGVTGSVSLRRRLLIRRPRASRGYCRPSLPCQAWPREPWYFSSSAGSASPF